jgi:chromate reductase
MARSITILGIVGSLRTGSYNKMALRAAMKLAPDDATIEPYELDGLPMFHPDLEKTPPPAIVDFKARVRAADAILFVTPEYNFSIPGVLKNAIDCASRPPGDSAWKGKPAAVMGAATGMLGTARAQYHLRQCFVFLDMPPVQQPEVLISFAAQKFDARGELVDETAQKLIRQLLENLVTLTRRFVAA